MTSAERSLGGGGFAVVDSLIIVAPIVLWGVMFGPCTFVIISLGKRKMVAFL